MRTTLPAAALSRRTVFVVFAVFAAYTMLAMAAPASSAAAKPAVADGVPLGHCAAGELCLWERPDFTGPRQVHELSGLDIESCVTLPTGTTALAIANRTGRPVTTYQSRECAETGEFETYPGGGTWVPQSPYRVRAFKVWET
ncbi:peptidase inhibitor family I36 protein [Streptomyces sp. NPDC127084]|uniref:peptidase inhibitor family I36 protein n=1 Tax=Streptomyces sp. NPDC127084 TaxID=3347133 RepID=UPI003646621F